MSSIHESREPSSIQPTPVPQGIEAVKVKGTFPGHKVTRLNIDPHDPARSVAILRIKQSGNFLSKLAKKSILKFSGKYIETTIKTVDAEGKPQHEKVAINIKSLSKRIELTYDDIKNLRELGQLEHVLQDVHNVARSEQNIHQALGAESAKRLETPQLARLFTFRVMRPQDTFSIGKTHLHFAGKEIRTEKELGKGTFGTAYKIATLSIETLQLSTFAQKISNINIDPDEPDLDIQAKEDLKAEAENLTEITKRAHDKGQTDALEGIQDAPLKVTFVGMQGIMKGKLYEGDLFEKLETKTMTPKEKLRGFDPLLKGLAFIQSENLVHVDIKPENIFVDKNDKGELIFKLADFGGAQWSDQIPTDTMLAHTPLFTPKLNEELPDDLTHEEYIDSLHRIGSFQMGVSLFEVLSKGKFPYPPSKRGQNVYQIPDEKTFNARALADYPPDVVQFVKSMVAPNPADRPIKNAIRDQWEKLTAKYGGIEKMAENIQAAISAKTTEDLG